MKTHPNFLSVDCLSKSYADKPVIDNFNYQFQPGCYAIIGPNGTGKSTLLRLLAGITEPDTGAILMNGYNLSESPVQVKAMLGYAPDKAMIYPFLTGREFLNLVICLKPETRSEELIKLLQKFKIESFLDTQIKDMSLGTQKKFFLIIALMSNPALVLMDEPTNGIDIEAKVRLIEHLNLCRKKSIILYATHDSEFISETQATPIHLPVKSS